MMDKWSIGIFVFFISCASMFFSKLLFPALILILLMIIEKETVYKKKYRRVRLINRAGYAIAHIFMIDPIRNVGTLEWIKTFLDWRRKMRNRSWKLYACDNLLSITEIKTKKNTKIIIIKKPHQIHAHEQQQWQQ